MNDFTRNDRFGGKRQGGFGGKPGFRSQGGFGRPQGQMHPAVCAQCGKATEVPFRPDGTRPIYCRDCFGGKDAAPARDFKKREFSKPSFRAPSVPFVKPQGQAPDPRIDSIQQHLVKLQAKVDQVLLEIAIMKAQKPAPTPEAAPAAPRKTATKKPAPAKKVTAKKK